MLFITRATMLLLGASAMSVDVASDGYLGLARSEDESSTVRSAVRPEDYASARQMSHEVEVLHDAEQYLENAAPERLLNNTAYFDLDLNGFDNVSQTLASFVDEDDEDNAELQLAELDPTDADGGYANMSMLELDDTCTNKAVEELKHTLTKLAGPGPECIDLYTGYIKKWVDWYTVVPNGNLQNHEKSCPILKEINEKAKRGVKKPCQTVFEQTVQHCKRVFQVKELAKKFEQTDWPNEFKDKDTLKNWVATATNTKANKGLVGPEYSVTEKSWGRTVTNTKNVMLRIDNLLDLKTFHKELIDTATATTHGVLAIGDQADHGPTGCFPSNLDVRAHHDLMIVSPQYLDVDKTGRCLIEEVSKDVPRGVVLIYNEGGVVSGYRGEAYPDWVKMDETVLIKVDGVAIDGSGEVGGGAAVRVVIKNPVQFLYEECDDVCAGPNADVCHAGATRQLMTTSLWSVSLRDQLRMKYFDMAADVKASATRIGIQAKLMKQALEENQRSDKQTTSVMLKRTGRLVVPIGVTIEYDQKGHVTTIASADNTTYKMNGIKKGTQLAKVDDKPIKRAGKVENPKTVSLHEHEVPHVHTLKTSISFDIIDGKVAHPKTQAISLGPGVRVRVEGHGLKTGILNSHESPWTVNFEDGEEVSVANVEDLKTVDTVTQMLDHGTVDAPHISKVIVPKCERIQECDSEKYTTARGNGDSTEDACAEAADVCEYRQEEEVKCQKQVNCITDPWDWNIKDHCPEDCKVREVEPGYDGPESHKTATYRELPVGTKITVVENDLEWGAMSYEKAKADIQNSRKTKGPLIIEQADLAKELQVAATAVTTAEAAVARNDTNHNEYEKTERNLAKVKVRDAYERTYDAAIGRIEDATQDTFAEARHDAHGSIDVLFPTCTPSEDESCNTGSMAQTKTAELITKDTCSPCGFFPGVKKFQDVVAELPVAEFQEVSLQTTFDGLAEAEERYTHAVQQSNDERKKHDKLKTRLKNVEKQITTAKTAVDTNGVLDQAKKEYDRVSALAIARVGAQALYDTQVEDAYGAVINNLNTMPTVYHKNTLTEMESEDLSNARNAFWKAHVPQKYVEEDINAMDGMTTDQVVDHIMQLQEALCTTYDERSLTEKTVETLQLIAKAKLGRRNLASIVATITAGNKAELVKAIMKMQKAGPSFTKTGEGDDNLNLKDLRDLKFIAEFRDVDPVTIKLSTEESKAELVNAILETSTGDCGFIFVEGQPVSKNIVWE